LIINRYPDSEYADRARALLRGIERLKRRHQEPGPDTTAPAADLEYSPEVEPPIREPAEFTGQIELEEVPDDQPYDGS
jgi:hypothetical protein